MLGVRASTCELEGDTVQPVTMMMKMVRARVRMLPEGKGKGWGREISLGTL